MIMKCREEADRRKNFTSKREFKIRYVTKKQPDGKENKKNVISRDIKMVEFIIEQGAGDLL